MQMAVQYDYYLNEYVNPILPSWTEPLTPNYKLYPCTYIKHEIWCTHFVEFHNMTTFIVHNILANMKCFLKTVNKTFKCFVGH